jgi:FKBP-type peptidyl-prolyl cis-trans isomerase
MRGAHLVSLVLLALGASSCAIFRTRAPVYEPVVTDSGLWFRDLVVPVEGRVVAEGDRVTIDYTLALEDGRLVDSSLDRGEPISFRLGEEQAPRGLEEGLIGMRVLGRRELRVPPELGYGAAGRPPDIPPEATLLIELELLQVE